MSVGNDKCAYFFFMFFKISCVRNNIIDTRCFFIGEMHTGVNYNDVILYFYGGHIFAYFFYSTKRNDANYPFFKWRNFILICILIATFSTERTIITSGLPVIFFRILISRIFYKFFRSSTPRIQTPDVWFSGLFFLYHDSAKR